MITFRLFDDSMNTQDSSLINKEFPLMGQVGYNLTKTDNGVVWKESFIPMVNSSFYYKIHIDNIVIG